MGLFCTRLLQPGKKNSFDYDRLLQFVRVVEDEEKNKLVLAYRNKEAESISHMFHMRWHYHHRYCKHNKVVIIEQMLIDAFAAAELGDSHSNCKEYEIIQQLQREDKPEARDILNKITNRDLYRAISKTHPIGLSSEEEMNEIREKIEEIERDIKIRFINKKIYLNVDSFDYGHGSEDPFADNKIPFYSKKHVFELLCELPKLPAIRPTCFQEIQITCVSKDKLKPQIEKKIRKFYDRKIRSLRETYQANLIEHQVEKLIEEYKDRGNQVENLKRSIEAKFPDPAKKRQKKSKTEVRNTILPKTVSSYSIVSILVDLISIRIRTFLNSCVLT
uniref:Uncharacterized protein n=1 Tax=Strigamia maritima TaxID=126957 RepID=T1II06_STRMM